MKKYNLSRIQVKSFRGIDFLDWDLDSEVVNVHAKNRGGKSTLMDAYLWGYSGVDSQGRTNHELKNTNYTGDPISRVPTTVRLTFSCSDNTILSFTRRFKEVLDVNGNVTGNSTDLWIGEEKIKTVTEFKNRLALSFSVEQYNILSSPTYFFNLPVNDQRKHLITLCGEVDDKEVGGDTDKFEYIIKELKDKSIDSLKTILKANIKSLEAGLEKLKAEKNLLSTKLLEKPDFSTLEDKIKQARFELKAHESNLKILEGENKENKVEQLVSKKLKIESDFLADKVKKQKLIEEKTKSFRDEITSIESKKYKLESTIKANEFVVADNDASLQVLRKQVGDENGKVFVEGVYDSSCNGCERPFTAAEIEARKDTAKQSFNTTKQEKITAIQTKGIALKKETDIVRESIVKQKEELLELINDLYFNQKKVNDLEATAVKITVEDTSEHIDVVSEIRQAELEAKNKELNNEDIKKLKLDIVTSNDAVELLIKESGKKDIYDGYEKDIKGLETRQHEAAQQIQDYKAKEDLVADFSSLKSKMIETKVNKMFQVVKFKLFEQLVKGGEKETCEATLNNVLYSTVNTEGKMNMFIDIANVFSSHFGLSLPKFIDNRESITNIIDTDSQIINLFVNPECETLTQL